MSAWITSFAKDRRRRSGCIVILLARPLHPHADKNSQGGRRAMKVFCVCGIGLSFVMALNAATAAAPDISGTYWATTYSPTIQVLGGGDPPLNAPGTPTYEKFQPALNQGSTVNKAPGA